MRFIISFLFLCSGVFVYVLFRPDVLFLLPLEKIMEIIPRLEIKQGFLAEAMVYNLPDALWYAAILVLQPNPWTTKWNWIIKLTASLPFIHEFSQLFGVLPGTFDITDLLFYVVTLTIFLITWKKEKTLRQDSSSLAVS